jgi:hypothetical protein
MGALLIQSHHNSTVERAWLVSRVVDGITVFGGLVLNETVGGFNPEAARLALELGAKEIWMPTRSAKNHRRHHEQPGGLTIFGRDGEILPQVHRIVSLVAGAGCILGTGHLSPEESLALIDLARSAGVKRILVTHPEYFVTFFPFDVQRRLASHGDVFFERCFVSTTHLCGHTPFDTIETAIVEAGVATTVIATDLGQPSTPAPVDGLKRFAERLLSTGFDRDQARAMIRDNPRRLIA